MGKYFVIMVFIVLPKFAIWSRLVGKGILISLSQWDLQQHMGTVCALELQPFPSPRKR